ncbi:uncharacterized protein FIBRA_07706 [Fibroporia radiculosa]|uniref:HCP-like protein n=1 Tax=Fibroporia radiculosa TaxID=599839 RepID=J4GVH1_9APHY|nr:uncharacterized protein FIBRA_07706 [Fibroporia radiculosa]CCM05485.1 predicted protein [Fibroporia radiculosa]
MNKPVEPASHSRATPKHSPKRLRATSLDFGLHDRPAQILKSPRQILDASATSYLVAHLPTATILSTLLSSIQQPTSDPSSQVAWCRDVLYLVDVSQRRQLTINSPESPAPISDPALQRLIDVALPMLLKLAARKKSKQSFVPGYVAEAIYLCALCEASGAYPQYISPNCKNAFSHFDQAAKAGYHPAWFRVGQDLEKAGDLANALSCYDCGVSHNVPSCLYRMGLAHLLGEMGLAASAATAFPLLKQAAIRATLDVSEPAFTYGLLLLNEFSAQVSPELIEPFIPYGSSPHLEARKQLERAAYLNYAPAQFYVGRAHEVADGPFPFDPVLSVQYYYLASSQGNTEADMALSKWFLCGCEDAFERDEGLSYSFAKSAAKRGLASAQFAMGYYTEIGIGSIKDVAVAKRWYSLASQQGNADAHERLQTLSRQTSLSRKEHENLTETRLIRTRTLARLRSQAVDKAYSRPPSSSTTTPSIPRPPPAAAIPSMRPTAVSFAPEPPKFAGSIPTRSALSPPPSTMQDRPTRSQLSPTTPINVIRFVQAQEPANQIPPPLPAACANPVMVLNSQRYNAMQSDETMTPYTPYAPVLSPSPTLHSADPYSLRKAQSDLELASAPGRISRPPKSSAPRPRSDPAPESLTSLTNATKQRSPKWKQGWGAHHTPASPPPVEKVPKSPQQRPHLRHRVPHSLHDVGIASKKLEDRECVIM